MKYLLPCALCVTSFMAFADDTPTAVRTGISRTIPTQIASETAPAETVRSAVQRTTVQRSVPAATSVSRVARPTNNLETVAASVGRNARTEGFSLNSTAPVRRAGISLRPSTAEVGGRAVIGNTGIQTGTNIGHDTARAVRSRAGTVLSDAMSKLEATAELNKSCQTQYNDCMDQFCGVIDANQKRCSCSANLTRYAAVEKAVKEANTQLNEVAQRIRYIGLSADEIRAIMSATEAEQVLAGTVDKTESRNMLSEIEKMIRNPSGAGTSGDGTLELNLEFDLSGESDDLFSLDFLNGTQAKSFSNLRGTELYNAAKKRCETVLNQCRDAGANSTQITGNYDLAIDKDCIAYEQGLNKMNDALRNNVRSANRMLQQARFAVLQNQNEFDAKGCIGALETCMTDDMVCGGNYFKCVDPTKRYIDENGTVILGQNISNILDFMKSFDNSAINRNFLSVSSTIPPTPELCKAQPYDNGACVVRYLLDKIGTGKTAQEGGLCRAVLDKCQRYTYNNGQYNAFNDIVVNYVQRAMTQVKAAQSKIIVEYAGSCLNEVATCYNSQVSQVTSWTNVANVDSVYRVMTGACRNVALTCAYAVFYNSDDENVCNDTASCIRNVSELFYQSMLCPENSTYSPETESEDLEGQSRVNARCVCNSGFENWGNNCYRKCTDALPLRDSLSGQCTACAKGWKFVAGLDGAAAKCERCTTEEVTTLGMKDWVPNSCEIASCAQGYTLDSDANKCVEEE